MLRAFLPFSLILVPVALAGAKPPTLALPYGPLVDRSGRIFVADAGHHQVVRYDPQRHRLVRVAGNGKAGSSGDGGPALRARLGEITSLAEDSARQLYVSDLQNGVVRRFVPGGRITTVARVPGVVGVDVDPAGRYLAIVSIERGVLRLNLSTGALETLVAVGHGVDDPHGLRYDSSGDLWVADPPRRVVRIDHSSGELNEVARIDTATVLPTARGVYVTVGGPRGGQVLLIRPDGSRRRVVGTGGISRQRNNVRATRVGIRPTGIALARNGSLLVAQDRPVPALRRVSRRGIITTVTR
jgi:sugar lactone lactonase YvrE